MEITRARAQDIDAILDLWGELAAFHADLDPARPLFQDTARPLAPLGKTGRPSPDPKEFS